MAFTFSLFSGCSGQKTVPQTVDSVDLERYSGKWYDIAHLPARFLTGCTCITAEYSRNKDNTIKVINRCYKPEKNKYSNITGKAFIVKNSNNTKLKVQFFWPFRGDYWIFELGDNYKYAVVGSPSGKYLWILSRTPSLPENLYNELLEKIESKGFDVEKLVRVDHENC